MSKMGLMIDYSFCSGCHTCEVACKNEKELPVGKWGIKLQEMGPWETSPGQWEWDYITVPTDYCDLCADRVEQGGIPSCALHCLCKVIEYGPAEELSAKMAKLNRKAILFTI